ncbi:uncharacterized protein [Fopius arisanus]|uniref:Peptidase aspartic putative domain-containing protein n=1 Tax=Fopius arisanus TaxID=64838 RepID=A0A9R1TPN9_9HYME|nr:PREDICTED: uncharacterized protein LOC105272856 [Fopius arisanus]
MKSHSASDLYLLTSSISEALSTLKALDQPTDHWGPVVVHVLTRRLSNKLREAWENKIGASTEYPSLDHLLDFLHGRSRAMETLEVGTQSLSSTSSSRPSQTTVQTRSMTKTSAKVNQMSASRPFQQSAPQPHGPSKKIQSTQSTSWTDAGYPCSYCKRDHYIASCSEFKALSPIARKEVADKLYLCYNCLGNHSIRVCQTSRTCRTCQERHHTLLHLDRSRRPAPTRPTSQTFSAQPQHQQSARPAQLSGVPSVTYNNAGEESLVRQLKLKKQRSSIQISGVGESSFGTRSGEVHLTLQSIYSVERINVPAHSLDHLTSSLPTFSAEDLDWDHLDDLNLPDPNFRVFAPIDLLIGADVFGRIIKPSIIKQGADAPVAQLTSFGWNVFGPTGTALALTRLAHHLAVSEVSYDQLEDLLSKFWIQEEVPGRVDSDLSADELSSLACLRRIIARISKDQRFFQLYSDFLKEYVDLDHMRLVVPSLVSSSSSVQVETACCSDGMTLAHEAKASGGLRVSEELRVGPSDIRRSYYLPHHGVVRESSERTKLRVVFNGSAKTSSGKSLNDILHTGAKLQRHIYDVLRWTRQHKVIFMKDITKMFRQIRVHEDDWPLQQILWIDSNGGLSTYQLTTVTYGTRSAPFLANRVLLQLVEEEGHRFPLAVDPIVKGRYVDEICGGADTHDQLLRTAQKVRYLCAAGGMPLPKWHSNSSALLRWLDPDSTSNDQRI